VLPTGLLATLGERAFGPLLCARFAALIEPARAVEVAARLPAPFLADVAMELDPRRASDVIGSMPAAQVAGVARELGERHEHVTLGLFVGHVSAQALLEAAAVLDDETLLSVAFVLENKDGLDELADVLGPARVAGLVRAGEQSELWSEGLDLLAALSADRREAIVAELSDRERARLGERAREAGVSELASVGS